MPEPTKEQMETIQAYSKMRAPAQLTYCQWCNIIVKSVEDMYAVHGVALHRFCNRVLINYVQEK